MHKKSEGTVERWSPIKRLRAFLSEHPSLKVFSSQRGFGELIDRSESYVRAMESNGKITGLVAKQMEKKMGVCAMWLLDPDVSPDFIPSDSGDELTHEMVIGKVRAQTADNHEEARRLLGSEPVSAAASGSRFAPMVDGLLTALRKKVIEELEEGRKDTFDKLMEVLGK